MLLRCCDDLEVGEVKFLLCQDLGFLDVESERDKSSEDSVFAGTIDELVFG